MSGLFPGPLLPRDLANLASQPLEPAAGTWFTASGHWALRLLLRQCALHPGARVAIPALICPSVVSAICAEGLQPAFVDIDPELYLMDFHADTWFKAHHDAIVLPHLYGLPHPQTTAIRDFARTHQIPLIHDAAQSYGIALDGTPLTHLDQGGLISFGPGKATTAAGGAQVHGLNPATARQLHLHRLRRWDPCARALLLQRLGIPRKDPWWWPGSQSVRASRIQAQAAHLVISRFAAIEQTRRTHWHQLRHILGAELLGTPPARSSYYKFIYRAPRDHWTPPPELHHHPWRRVVFHEATGALPHYRALAGTLIEFSTERPLPS
ncbi:MAG: DegT/DnrJ/EryC1/StrS aminotransferase family protein [Magnetococcales bacterium]|nr:DegT/DnrJ/EryC1/StrS aminotransferase family protein [Magnetococcales bacterium]